MKLEASFKLDLEDESGRYLALLKEEDYEFKTKDIKIVIPDKIIDNSFDVKITANSIIDMKIASSAFIKSLEIIEKTSDV